MTMYRRFNATATGAFNRTYSPLTLSNDWPKMGRLLFMIGCSTIGSTMNGFFVASFFVEHTLKKVGNVFLACVGLADLIITTAIIPTCAVVLLSGEWDLDPVCYALQLLGQASTYCYSLFFMLVAAENYYRICRTPDEYEVFLSMRVGMVSVLVFASSFAVAGIGVYMDLDYDYCRRRHYGHFYYRAATAVLFHAVPFIITAVGLIAAAIYVRRKARTQIQYKRSQLFERDNSITALNITAYVIFVIAWIPYLVVVHEYPSTSDAKYYNTAWLGLFRSVITSFFYSCLNRNFRRAFAHLFNYCCCKSTLSGSFSSRHRRGMEYKHTTGDVRVHIMHQAISVNSPPRAACSTRATQEL